MSQIQISAISNFVILQDPPADEVVVSFPDDYPNSVRHFLMVGFFGMLLVQASSSTSGTFLCCKLCMYCKLCVCFCVASLVRIDKSPPIKAKPFDL